MPVKKKKTTPAKKGSKLAAPTRNDVIEVPDTSKLHDGQKTFFLGRWSRKTETVPEISDPQPHSNMYDLTSHLHAIVKQSKHGSTVYILPGLLNCSPSHSTEEAPPANVKDRKATPDGEASAPAAEEEHPQPVVETTTDGYTHLFFRSMQVSGMYLGQHNGTTEGLSGPLSEEELPAYGGMKKFMMKYAEAGDKYIGKGSATEEDDAVSEGGVSGDENEGEDDEEAEGSTGESRFQNTGYVTAHLKAHYARRAQLRPCRLISLAVLIEIRTGCCGRCHNKAGPSHQK